MILPIYTLGQPVLRKVAEEITPDTCRFWDKETGKKLEEKARFIANKTLKEALHGLTLEELRISQEVLRKIFNNTKD